MALLRFQGGKLFHSGIALWGAEGETGFREKFGGGRANRDAMRIEKLSGSSKNLNPFISMDEFL